MNARFATHNAAASGPVRTRQLSGWAMTIGGLYGALAVGGGAYGAHGLKDQLDAAAYAKYCLALDYLLVHATIIFACGVALRALPENRSLLIATGLFSLGIVLFSGGLIGSMFGLGTQLGKLAPMGGTMLIVGWLALAFAGFRSRGSTHGR